MSIENPKFNMPEPEEQQKPEVSPEELKGIEKEMHMRGRAMRIDETLEQYRLEREQSWREIEAKKLKDHEELKKIRRSLGIESAGEQNKPEDKYKSIATKIPINEKQPLTPEEIFPIMAGNMFGENDEQTLAGRAIGIIYDKLVERQDHKSSFTPQEILQMGRESLKDFKEHIKDEGHFPFDVLKPAGKSGFHLNGEDGYVSRDHLFYFNKSTREWKNPNEQQTRAYLTIDPAEIKSIQRHFVDLCIKLYEAGVDFTGKAASPYGLEKRTDNMVFYITDSDKAKAQQIIKGFLKEHNIGRGNVEAAQSDAEQDGLSWAPEPNDKDIELWQEVSGSSERASYNIMVATKVVPRYLKRLAEAHSKLGNTEEANVFSAEANRVDKLINESESS